MTDMDNLEQDITQEKITGKKHISSGTSRRAFSSATSRFQKYKNKINQKWAIILGVLCVLIGGYAWYDQAFVPPKGNNLYGICRTYIEQKIPFPHTFRVLQMKQYIPEKEDPNNPQRIAYEVFFTHADTMGNHKVDSMTCGFRFRQDLAGTPWQGIMMEYVIFNNKKNHAWTDRYYPPHQKSPRAPDDRSEDVERFQAALPGLLSNPPDLSLPFKDLQKMPLENLRDVQ